MANPARKQAKPPHGRKAAQEMEWGVPDIFQCSAADDAEGVDAALRAGVDVNSVDKDLMTPLHYAAAALAFNAADRLLLELTSDNPLDPTLIDRFGRTASATALEVCGVLGVGMARKLRPFCYPPSEEPS